MAKRRPRIGAWLVSLAFVLGTAGAIVSIEWGAITGQRRFMLIVVLAMVAAFGCLLLLSFVVDRDR